jgi:hypothetical protein
MASTEQVGAAAQADGDTPPVPSRPTLDGSSAGTWPDAIAVLVGLATDVLRVLAGVAPVGVDPTKLDPQRVADAAPSLGLLRAFLQDYADGLKPVDTDERARSAAAVLRSILEVLLDRPILLPGEAEREPPADDELPTLCETGVALTRGDESDHRWTIRNLTDHELPLAALDGTTWLLPAYGCRTLDRDPHVELFLRGELARGELEVGAPQEVEEPEWGTLGGILIGVVFGAFVVGGIWGVWAWIGAAVVAVGVVTGFLLVSKGAWFDPVRGFLSEVPGRVLQFLSFLFVLAIGVALPAAVIVFGADLRDELRAVWDGEADAAEYLTIVCRAMQLVLISIASLLPALLYYQFDRDRLSTLRQKFVHQIFRLDASMTTRGAIDAKYGQLIDEIYGPERTGRFRKLLPGRRAPILVATLLIMLGWLLVMLNPDVGLITSESEIAELFQPRHTAPAFAFLGAYFFTAFALLRGYVRRDLRPKSYSDISVRIITVVILAWVLELLLVDDSESLLVFAFIAGIVPQAALNFIREVWQRTFRKLAGSRPDDSILRALADALPLTDLEGIDLYDRTRLSSEGVTNIEALAHHDLVELMLQTRIPVPRLIDWTDQAVLHLHFNEVDRKKLKSYGIRTASDLLQTRDCAEARDELDAFLALLDGNADATKPPRMQVILDAISDEEWIASLRHWHEHDVRPCETATPPTEPAPAANVQSTAPV